MQWTDRLLGAIGLQRKVERRNFAGAQSNRLTADWIFGPMQSANDEWKKDGWKLRGRGREMVRNDPTFARYVHLLADNVIGAQGVRVAPLLYGPNGRLLEKESRELGYAYDEFSERENFSRDGRLSRAEFAQQIVRLTPPDGECFVKLVPTRENRFGLSCELVDPDLVDNEYYQERTSDRNEIHAGIEIDRNGRPVRYHVFRDYNKRGGREPIDARWMLHLYWPRRPGDVRGITKFASVMMLARMLHGYREAEVVAARTAAAKMAFLELKNPEAAPDNPDEKPELPMNAAAGTIEELPFGYELKTWDPQHPSTAYDAFVRSVKGDIAAGLSHAYVTLFGDWSQTNYSSGKMPVFQERDHYRTWQQWEIKGFERQVYRRFIELANLRSAITLPTAEWQQHLDAAYMPRAWPLFNPKEDLDVMKVLLELKLTTRTELAAQLGVTSWEDILERYAEEVKLAKDKYELDLSFTPAGQAATTPTQETDNGTQGTANGNAAKSGADRTLRAVG